MRSVSIFGATGSIGENTVELIRRQGGTAAFRIVALTGGRNVARLAETGARARRRAGGDGVSRVPRGAEGGAGGHRDRGRRGRRGDRRRGGPAGRLGDVGHRRRGRAGAGPPGAGARHDAGAGQQGKPGHRRAAADGRGGAPRRHRSCRSTASIRPSSRPWRARTSRRSSGSSSPPRAARSATGAPSNWPRATPEQAVAHPNWSMGQRITIDSARLFNKALELIETKEFFGVAPDRIEVLVHPQSIVHALVGFRDGGADGASRPARHAPCHRLRAELARAPRRCRSSGSISRGSGRSTSSRPTRCASPRCGWRAR